MLTVHSQVFSWMVEHMFGTGMAIRIWFSQQTLTLKREPCHFFLLSLSTLPKLDVPKTSVLGNHVLISANDGHTKIMPEQGCCTSVQVANSTKPKHGRVTCKSARPKKVFLTKSLVSPTPLQEFCMQVHSSTGISHTVLHCCRGFCKGRTLQDFPQWDQ